MNRASPRPLQRIAADLWAAAVSPYATLTLLGVCLGFALLCGLLPQADAETLADAAAYQRWVQPIHARWGDLGEALGSLGLLRVVHTRVYALFLALSAGHCLLRLLCALFPAWEGVPPHAEVWRQRTAERPATTRARLKASLAREGCPLVTVAEDDGPWRARTRETTLSRLTPALVYAGLLLLLGAALVSARFGWASPTVDLALGESGLLDAGEKLVLRLDQLELYGDEGGGPGRFISHLTVIEGLAEVGTLRTTPRHRATYGGVAIYQLGYGPAVRVRAWDVTGRQVDVRELATGHEHRVGRIRLSGWQREHMLAVPETGLVLRLVHYPGALDQGYLGDSGRGSAGEGRRLHVQVLRGRDQAVMDEQFLTESGTLTAAGLQLAIDFEYYVRVRAEREPELPLAAVGGGCLLTGAVGALWVQRRDLWVVVAPEGEGSVVEMAVPRRHVESAWWRRLIDAATSLGDPKKPDPLDSATKGVADA